MQLRRIDPTSVLKTAFLLYALFGLVFAAFLVVFFLLGQSASAGTPTGGGYAPGVLEIVLIAVFSPAVYGLAGAVVLGLAAVLYNWVASWTGGIEVELS